MWSNKAGQMASEYERQFDESVHKQTNFSGDEDFDLCDSDDSVPEYYYQTSSISDIDNSDSEGKG